MRARRIHVIATGGTIESSFDGGRWVAVPGSVLVEEVRRSGALDALTERRVSVTTEHLFAGQSSSLHVDHMSTIARHAQDAARSGAHGVVVLHGTDTIELSAYLTDLLIGSVARQAPVVFTGAMRVHSHADADGPANIAGSIALAASTAAIGCEVMVCMGGVVHASSRVAKVDARSLDAFTSAPFAPLGSVVDGQVSFLADSPLRPDAGGLYPEVPLLTAYPGMAAEVFERAAHRQRGIVLEVFGDLNVPRNLWDGVRRATRSGVLVVLASRAFTDTIHDEGIDQLGAVGAGGLTPQKARLATMAALGTSLDRDEACRFLARLALPYDPGDRRGS